MYYGSRHNVIDIVQKQIMHFYFISVCFDEFLVSLDLIKYVCNFEYLLYYNNLLPKIF